VTASSRRLKQQEVGARAGLSEAYVNRLENGLVANPKINDLAGIADTPTLWGITEAERSSPCFLFPSEY
jgi:transcriptional regulator with XRE-family HTH domain